MSTSTLFSNLVRVVEGLGLSVDQTRYAISLGSRDGWSGWRAVTHNTSTIEMVILPRAAASIALKAGVFARHDLTGWTTTAVAEGDMVKDASNVYYEILTVKKVQVGNMLFFYECELAKLPLYQAEAGATTWNKTRSEDPRRRTKVFIDTYADNNTYHSGAPYITKDNDSTQATWACIFNNPPYHLAHEFRAASTPVQGLYVVDMPNSTPLLGVDQVPYGYEEHVPIHICTVNSTACNGSALNWKMEEELRYACEENPTGSQRALDRARKLDRDLGGMWLYDREFIMNYRRDTS